MSLFQIKLQKSQVPIDITRAVKFLINSLDLLGFPLLSSDRAPMIGGVSKDFGQFSILLRVESSWEDESCLGIQTLIVLEFDLIDAIHGVDEWIPPAIHCVLDSVILALSGRILDAGREFFQRIPEVLTKFSIKPGARLAEGISAHEPSRPVPDVIDPKRVLGAALNS